jgi:hypothetical protein
MYTRFQFVQCVDGGSDVTGEPRVWYGVFFTLSDNNKLGRRCLESHRMQRGWDRAAVRVAGASIGKQRVHAHELPERRRVRPQAAHAPLTRHLIEGHETSVDDGVTDVFLKGDLLNFGFRIEVEKQLLLQLENGGAAPDELCLCLS